MKIKQVNIIKMTMMKLDHHQKVLLKIFRKHPEILANWRKLLKRYDFPT